MKTFKYINFYFNPFLKYLFVHLTSDPIELKLIFGVSNSVFHVSSIKIPSFCFHGHQIKFATLVDNVLLANETREHRMNPELVMTFDCRSSWLLYFPL